MALHTAQQHQLVTPLPLGAADPHRTWRVCSLPPGTFLNFHTRRRCFSCQSQVCEPRGCGSAGYEQLTRSTAAGMGTTTCAFHDGAFISVLTFAVRMFSSRHTSSCQAACCCVWLHTSRLEADLSEAYSALTFISKIACARGTLC